MSPSSAPASWAAPTAYYLAKGGVDVAVIERGNVNREASGANAGSLHLQIYIHPHFPDDWIDRIRPTIALMREAAEELGDDGGASSAPIAAFGSAAASGSPKRPTR